jgi:hypothetical protein
MTLVHASEQFRQPPPEKRYRSRQELDMRDRLETWARVCWPGARVVHELVVGRGEARADMAVIDVASFVAMEIKSDFDSASRLMAQVCMFRLVCPELYLVTGKRFSDDADLVRYLIPSVGHIKIETDGPGSSDVPVVTGIASRFEPHPKTMLQLLWVNELWNEATRHALVQTSSAKPGTHAFLVDKLLKLTPDEQMRSVCRQLRARKAYWRADPPIKAEAA